MSFCPAVKVEPLKGGTEAFKSQSVRQRSRLASSSRSHRRASRSIWMQTPSFWDAPIPKEESMTCVETGYCDVWIEYSTEGLWQQSVTPCLLGICRL